MPVAAPAKPAKRPLLTRRGVAFAIILLAACVALGFGVDWAEVGSVLRRAHWRLLWVALAFSALSYFCLSLGFALVNRVFRIRWSVLELMNVGFVTFALISALGGVVGHTARTLLMARRGLNPGDILAPSLFHSYFESVVFYALIPTALVCLLLTQPLSGDVALSVAAGIVILGALFAVTAAVFFLESWRRPALRLLAGTWRLLARRDLTTAIQAFETTFKRGMAEVGRRPGKLALPMLLILGDRAARVATLWVCFAALGGAPEFGAFLAGFAIGVALGVMSMIPGGLGAQEGAMAGTYALLGVPLEQALVASVLFRVTYYLAPFGLSLALYWPILRRAQGNGEPPQSTPPA